MRLVFQKIIVFALTFLSYAGLHALREGWSFSKAQLSDEFDVSLSYLGLVDTLYLLSYSIGMAVFGTVIHRIPLKWYVIGGMLLSAVCYSSFAFVYSVSGLFGLPLLTVAMCLNGFFQATGWPGIMGIFGSWFEKNKKGVLMAVWSMNANTGNIIANFICNLLQQAGASWTLNFFATALFAVVVAVLMIVFLQDKPKQTESEKEPLLTNSETQNKSDNDLQKSLLTEKQEPEKPKPKPISIWKAIFLPRVPAYVVSYACIKGCIYGLLFWLPTYLDSRNLGDQKGYISSMIDIGALVGSTLVGFLADRFNRRAIFLSPLLFLSAIVMFIVSYALTESAWQYYFTMLLIGLFIGGPYNIIATVIAIDLGQQTGSSTNITSVSSLIEGTAAVFAAVSQLVIPIIELEFIFFLFAGECILAGFILLLPFHSQLKLILKERKQKVNNQENP